MNGKDCTQCIHNDGCHIHCICHNQERFEPKEQPMSERCKDIKCEWYNPLMEYGCAHGELEQSCIKEKPMENKVIFESEEECADFLCDVYNHSKGYCLRSLVPMAKQKGYIRKSAVEEAEEKWNNMKQGIKSNPVGICFSPDGVISLADIFIQELKAENERLKK